MLEPLRVHQHALASVHGVKFAAFSTMARMSQHHVEHAETVQMANYVRTFVGFTALDFSYFERVKLFIIHGLHQEVRFMR